MKPNVILGKFPFAIDTAMYQQLQRSTTHRYAMQDRVGKPPSYQNLGKGEDEITLNGMIMPTLTGFQSTLSVDSLREMMQTGKSYPLILVSFYGWQGDINGDWFIHGVDENQSELFGAAPQKIEFTLKLKRDYGD